MHDDDPFGFDSLDLGWLRAKQGVKWHRSRGELLAAWVADMDFPAPTVVTDALRAYVDRADLGYADFRNGTGLAELFAGRMAARHGWAPDPSLVHDVCDVVQGVRMVVHLMTQPGDGIAFHTPAYPPFHATVADMGRPLTPIWGERDGTGWRFDLERFEADLTTALSGRPCRVLVLCNPHNPTGHVFTRTELEALAQVVLGHDLLVISDEIHAELTFDARRHIPFASLGDDVAARTVTLTSATKSFNLAAIRCAVLHAGAPAVHAALAALPSHLFGAVSPFGVLATTVAWTQADDWQAAVVRRLSENRHVLARLLAERPALAAIDYAVPEATYLAWLDCRPLGLAEEPVEVFRAGAVELSPGPDFGEQGVGFVRLNLATSPPVLTAIADAMAAAV